LDFAHTEIDHILPEYLVDDPEELQRVLAEYGLPANFNVSSFENWLRTHGSCNRKKRDHLFRPTPIIQVHIDRARSKAPAALRAAEKARSDKEISKAIGTLATGPTALPRPILDLIVQHYASSNSERQVIGIRIETPREGQIGMARTTEVYGYVPPSEVRLAPHIRIVFDQEPQPTADAYFHYTLTAPSE
jgi:hypothetical protein